jgi:hypothetical protein
MPPKGGGKPAEMRAFSFSERRKNATCCIKGRWHLKGTWRNSFTRQKNAVTFVTFVTVDNQILIK